MKTRPFVALVLLLSCLCLARPTSAQTMGAYGSASGHCHVYPHVYGGYGYHASTAAEGYLRGLGAAAVGAGQYNRLTSIAALNYQQAYSRSLENQLKKAETYFALRQLNAQKRNQERPRPTAEQLRAYSKVGVPARPDSSQLDPTFGRINWPASLKADRFADYRNKLNRLFAERAAGTGGQDTDNYYQVLDVTRQFREELKGHLTDMRPMEFMAAKKFIDGLAYEARFASLPTGVASK